MSLTPLMIARELAIGYVEGNGDDILSTGINFELNSGELVCLIGPNGAGKSTLIRTIAGLQPALGGSIELLGKKLTSYQPHQIAQMISLVLTTPVNVVNMTAYELVSLGRHPFTDWLGRLTNQDHEIVINAMRATGADEYLDRDITHLSDGERQKIMIARALAQQPNILILDEPTAFLDFPNRVEILAMLRKLANQNHQAVLLSTHDLNLAIGVADKMLIIDEYGNLSIGSPEDLILNGNFEHAFNPQGSLQFNPFEGTFSFHFENGHRFSIHADNELLANWTRKAIERLGYHEDPEAETAITVVFINEAPVWNVITGSNQKEFDSIYSLMQYLRS